jgi:hypothetical protein
MIPSYIKLTSIAALGFVLILGRGGRADVAAFTFTGVTNDATNGAWSLGYEFQVNAPITVTQLGFYDSGQDGLAESHAVGIYDLSQNLLVSGTVDAGTTDALVGFFRYKAVDPTLLGVGTYVIAAASGTENYTWDPIGLSSAPEVTWVEDRYLFGSVLAFPADGPNGRIGIFGPNFEFGPAVSSVPEPSTLALAGAGLAGMAGAALRRRAARTRAA